MAGRKLAGAISPEQLAELRAVVKRMHDAAILRQRAKIQLILDPEIERNAEEQREAIVEVTLVDGAQLREHTTAVRGTAQTFPSPDA